MSTRAVQRKAVKKYTQYAENLESTQRKEVCRAKPQVQAKVQSHHFPRPIAFSEKSTSKQYFML